MHTARQEFDYPSGDQNKYSTYEGPGGFPVGSFLVKLAAAISEGEPNMIFTGYLTGESRMMIHRHVQDRLQHLAGFLQWDQDPYMVITDDGRLVWMVDAYTTSLLHPYSATLPVAGLDDGANYIRNAVKATVDAYTGKVSLYVYDPTDPIIQAYEHLFPNLFLPYSEMPADLRRHARYPQALFRTQAEAYRSFHMRDPQVFYNKEDIWDIARNLFGQSGQPEPVQPTYIVATLPGEKDPEYLLILPFTPRGKDNLIGWMAARCDVDHLGELIFYQLSEAATGVRTHADRVAHRPGSEHLQGPYSVEPAGIAGAARKHHRPPRNGRLLVRRIDLHPGGGSEDAATQEGGSGGGRPSDLPGYLR